MARRYIPTAAETEEGMERERAYYAALGEFVDLFSRVEVALQITLWHYSKMKQQVAKAAFYGTRADAAMSLIKRILDAADAPQSVKDELKDVFQQAGIIRGVRNDILHLGAEDIATGQGYVTNEMLVHTPDRVNKFPISDALLKQMNTDLRKIMGCLLTRHMGRSPARSLETKELIASILQAPWRYKHPAPQKSRSKTAAVPPARKRGPKPPRQPQSSGA